MRRLFAIAIPATLLFAAACASTDDVKTIDRQVAELQDQLAQVKTTSSSKEEVQSVNAKVAEQTQTLLKSNASMSVKVNEMEDKLQNTQGSIEQTNYRIDRLVQQVTQMQHDLEDIKAELMRAAAPTAAPSAPPGSGGEMSVTAPATPPAAAAPSEDPIQTYQSAYRDYQRGNFDLAIAGFQDFMKRNASSDLADNASYWIGESLYSQKKYREAIQQFDLVVTRFPKSDKVPASLLKKGYGYINLGEKAQGVVQLQYVVHEHPGSEEASLARQKLRAMGIETK
jgi:tol-pal system protein YbgF